MLHKNIVSEKDCNEIVSWWKEQKPLYEYRMIVKALQLAKNNESLHLVVESPQEAFDRGYTAGLNVGKKLAE